MNFISRFVVGLVLGLAGLAWLASIVLEQTTRVWFEKDLSLRARLAVNGSRQSLLRNLREGDQQRVRAILEDITRDERIMGASACGRDLATFVRTENFPGQSSFSCEEIGAHVRPLDGPADAPWREWDATIPLASGSVHVSAIPIADDAGPAGLVVLVHDLSFIERREGTMRRLLLFAFLILAIAAAVAPVAMARLAWKRWYAEVQSAIREGGRRFEYQPLVQDVHDLVDRIAGEKDADRGRGWTPARLKATLTQLLHGERVVILANREPYIHERAADGTVIVQHPASGLVTALEPVMRACSGTWVAHGSGSADREMVDPHDRIAVPPGDSAYSIRRVWLTHEEEKGYYYGFANEGLWPLCHIADTRPTFREQDWMQYRAVNQKFADAVCDEVDSSDPIILVQDYHFALAPRMIRERLPRATIITFWHIPWPNPERFSICPYRIQLLEGLLGSSIMGFHTQFHCNNFLDAVDRFLEARLDREQHGVILKGRTTLVRPYPISIEWPSQWVHDLPSPAECRASVLEELNLPRGVRLGVGVDRLDYTKGIAERLQSVERTLERFPELRGKLVFVQIAAPSRTIIESYRQLDENVEKLVRRINERFGAGDYQPVILRRAHHEPPTVFRYYRAADFCYVSSLHDGMNLVAKEFISSRDDERGVLILSHFTGASRELTEALIVNPYDLGEASDAIWSALAMSGDEQRDRMRAMRSYVSEFNVYRWAGRMLEDGARLRRKERLTGRLAERVEGAS
jgi:trehalose 6-phosphate synthase